MVFHYPSPKYSSYDEQQPDPYGSKYVPSSLLYNPSTAPRFTGGPIVPLPIFSSSLVEATQTEDPPCTEDSPEATDVPYESDDSDDDSDLTDDLSSPYSGDDLGYGEDYPRPADAQPTLGTTEPSYPSTPKFTAGPERTPCTFETRVRPTASADSTGAYKRR